jgi:hypothetical protein
MHVNVWNKNESAPGWADHQEADSRNLRKSSKTFQGQSQAKQDECCNDEKEAYTPQKNIVLHDQMHCFENHAESRDAYTDPKCELLWRIKSHGFHSSGKMMDRIFPPCPAKRC